MIIDLTKHNFEAEVLRSDIKVFIDFWAPRCLPCRQVAPIIEELASEIKDVKFCRLNVDEETLIAMQHGVLSIPTFMIYENGEMTAADAGFMQKEELLALLEK